MKVCGAICWIQSKVREYESSGVKVAARTGKMPLVRIYGVCASDSGRCCCAGARRTDAADE